MSSTIIEAIEDDSWDPIIGCTRMITEGCKNCYAEHASKNMEGRTMATATGSVLLVGGCRIAVSTTEAGLRVEVVRIRDGQSEVVDIGLDEEAA